MELVWRDSEGEYTSGEYAYLGKYKVFSVYYNATRSKGDDANVWRISCSLPGIKPDLGCAETDEMAKAFCQKVIDMWIKNAGLSCPHPPVESPTNE
jgi:hypothetical protein